MQVVGIGKVSLLLLIYLAAVAVPDVNPVDGIEKIQATYEGERHEVMTGDLLLARHTREDADLVFEWGKSKEGGEEGEGGQEGCEVVDQEWCHL
jgi:hypothetical protein